MNLAVKAQESLLSIIFIFVSRAHIHVHEQTGFVNLPSAVNQSVFLTPNSKKRSLKLVYLDLYPYMWHTPPSTTHLLQTHTFVSKTQGWIGNRLRAIDDKDCGLSTARSSTNTHHKPRSRFTALIEVTTVNPGFVHSSAKWELLAIAVYYCNFFLSDRQLKLIK